MEDQKHAVATPWMMQALGNVEESIVSTQREPAVSIDNGSWLNSSPWQWLTQLGMPLSRESFGHLELQIKV